MSARIQQIYIAMFGRPADPLGLAFWNTQTNNGANLAPIINALSGTPEYQARFAGQSNVQLVNSIYQSLFGRDADVAGLTFFTNALASGRQSLASIAVNILDGAQGADLARITNKVTAATNFTNAIDTTAEIIGYNASAVPAAQAFLSAVTDNAATIPTATATDAAVLAATSGGGQGQQFTLTPNTDNLTGTVGSDTFIAGPQFNAPSGTKVEVLAASDVINGGAGTDTLSYLKDAAGAFTLPAATLTSIEAVKLTVNGAITADVSASADVRTLSATATTADVILLTTKANVTDVTVSKAAATSAITDSATTGDTLASVSTTSATGALTINSDALKSLSVISQAQDVTVNAATATRELALTLNNVTGGNISDVRATSVAITTTGDKSLNLTLTTDAATSVTIAGDKSLSLTLADATLNAATVTTVTSTNSAGVTIASTLANNVAFTGGAGKDAVTVGATTKTVDMGAGDDTVTLTGATSALGAGGALKGGEGIDTLAFTNSADAATASATATFKDGVSGFERVQVGTVQASATDTINLTNLNDINYVKSSGTSVGPGSAETATFTFGSLLSGQGVILGLGDGTFYSYTAPTTQTAAQVAAGVSAGINLPGYTDAPAGSTVVFTSTGTTNLPNVSAAATFSPALPTAPVVVTTQGVAGVPGTTESSTVTFQSLVAGESVTAAGRTFTAGVSESGTYTFGILNNGDVITIAGRTITATGGNATASDVAAAFRLGTTQGNAVVSGALTGATTSGSGANATFTSTFTNTNVADFTVGGTGAASVTAGAYVQGASTATAAQVAAAMAGGPVAGGSLSGGLAGFTAGPAAGNAVTFTSTTTNSNVTDIAVTTTAGTPPGVVTTQGVAVITPVNESSVVNFSSLTDGQSVTVAGRTVTANGGNLTAAQVADGFFGGVNSGFVNVSGSLALFSVANAVAGDSALEFTSLTPATNVTDITLSLVNAPFPALPTVAVVDGSPTAGGGQLVVTNMGANGTLELTGAINGASSVALKDATGTSDVFNVILNGTGNIVNTAALTVAGVETVNITTTDSQSDATTLNNPGTASTILLNATAAKTVTVTGNHGVNFTGSTLSAVNNLDASGVNATFAVGGTPGTAATAATAATVTFTSTNTTEAVSIKGGNGDDMLTAAAGSTKVFTIDGGAGNDTIVGAGGADVITGGAGNDVITGGLGADVLTGGAGNDVFNYSVNAQSTLATRDRITDFNANTVGNGAGGAANNTGAVNAVGSYNGDVIDLTGFAGLTTPTTINFSVQGSAANATTFLANGAFDGPVGNNMNIALDSSTGFVYIDRDDDGVADMVIELTGVTTLTTAAFQIA